MTEEKMTTLALSLNTKTRLMAYGKMGETHDEVLSRVLDFVEGKQKVLVK